MAQYIIDFQAFKDEKNHYILKEVAIVSVFSDKVVHCLVKPPQAFCGLTPNCKALVNYLTSNQHGIFWEDGYMTAPETMRLIREVTRDAEKVLIKGSERAKYMSILSRKPATDLDTLSCPRAKDLPSVTTSPDCFYYRHTPSHHPYFEACSLRRVYKLKQWYLEYLKNITVANQGSKDEHDTVENGYDIAPCRIQERLCCGRITPESKFTRSSYY